MNKYVPLAILIALLVGAVVMFNRPSLPETSSNSNLPTAYPTNQNANCKPTFADSGGPYYQANAPFRSKIAPDTNQGEILTVNGKVLANDCLTPQPNITIDIWQANESGSYEDEWYRGQITTNDQGEYQFETVVPKGYGEGTGYRPPHIHFKIWRDEQLVITSQMFLPASREQGIEEAYIIEMLTNQDADPRSHQGYHDIILP